MQERYIATADLGSSKTGLCVARVEGGDVQVIYYRETPSEGIRNSGIFNAGMVEASLKEAVRVAEDELKIKILQLIVGLPRYALRQEIAKACLQRTDPNTMVGHDDVNFIKDMALGGYPLEDPKKEAIYGAVAQSFNADDLVGENEDNIIGTCCETLEGNFKLFIGSQKSMFYIDRTLADLGISAAKKVFTPISTAEAVLTDDEKDNGVALVEIGAGVTSVTIYKGKILRHYSSIPFGGKSVTADIRYECGFGESLAENVKLAYGACLPDKLQSMSDKILQINDEDSGSYDHLPVKYLSEIINSRCKEILEAILYHIQESGYADKLRSGIVLTGGGANMTNIAGLLKILSGYNVRTGYPRCRMFHTEGCPGIWETGAAASVGMLLEGSMDGSLNCIDAVPQPKTDPEPATPEDNPVNYGELFSAEECGELKEEPKKKKSGGGSRKNSNIFWKKMSEKAGQLFDATIGQAYDETEESNRR